jgi:hypothetical protein
MARALLVSDIDQDYKRLVGGRVIVTVSFHGNKMENFVTK